MRHDGQNLRLSWPRTEAGHGTGHRAVRQTLAGKSLPTSLAIRRTIADHLVLAKVRDALVLTSCDGA